MNTFYIFIIYKMQKSKSMKSRLNMRNRRTKRNRMVIANKHYTNASKSHLVGVFLEMLNMVKLYHWKTQSYA